MNDLCDNYSFSHDCTHDKLHALYHQAETARLLRARPAVQLSIRLGGWRLTLSQAQARPA